MKSTKFTKLHQKQGVALLSVLLFFMVMVIMIGSLSILTHGNFRNSTVPTYSVAAYYAAEAGTNMVVSDFNETLELNKNVTQENFIAALNTFTSTNKVITLNTNKGSPTTATVTFKDITSNTSSTTGVTTFSFVIESTGQVNGQSRTLHTLVDLDYSTGAGTSQGFAVKHAILVENSISLDNTAVVRVSQGVLDTNPDAKPYIATLSTTSNSIIFGKPEDYTGFVEVKEDTPPEVTNLPVSQITDTLDITEFKQLNFDPVRELASNVPTSATLSTVPGIDSSLLSGSSINPSATRTYTLPGGSYYVPEIVLNRSGVVLHADNDVFLVTDSLRILDNVSFTGSGELKIYVRRNFVNGEVVARNPLSFSLPTSNNKIIGRKVNPQLLVVYVDEYYTSTSNNNKVTPVITMPNNGEVYGSFMFNNASVNFANNTSFGGYLMTGGPSVNLNNNGAVITTLYYAPNATVTVQNNGVVQGAIISKSAVISNGADIAYDPAALTNFPFSVDSPIVGEEISEGALSLVFKIHQTIEQ